MDPMYGGVQPLKEDNLNDFLFYNCERCGFLFDSSYEKKVVAKTGRACTRCGGTKYKPAVNLNVELSGDGYIVNGPYGEQYPVSKEVLESEYGEVAAK